MYDEGVLFLIFIQEIGHLQSIDLSPSEQSHNPLLEVLYLMIFDLVISFIQQ